MSAQIISYLDFAMHRRRRQTICKMGYFARLCDLPIGLKVELLLENGSTCVGWKSNGRDGDLYWAPDEIHGGYRKVSPLGWKPQQREHA